MGATIAAGIIKEITEEHKVKVKVDDTICSHQTYQHQPP
jgi:hypothetical protein